MTLITYNPQGVCSKEIQILISEEGTDKENNIIRQVSFSGGCPGNALALGLAVEGRTVKEIMNLLKGVKCGSKESSCPDQLSKALEEYINN